MNVSVKSGYALQALYDLAAHHTGGPVRIADIARRQRIPQKFLELILAGLKQGGFVESRRGAEGGYLLVRPADSITVGEVLRYVEGQAPKGRGRRGGETPFSDLWRRVEQVEDEILDHTTFAELVRTWAEKAAKYVPSWDI